MKDSFDKRWDQFLQEAEDFRSGKRKKYPAILAEPLYVDPKLWEPEPQDGRVLEKQRLCRQYINIEIQSRWRLLFLTYGMDPNESSSMTGWEELCEKLAFRHVPGFQTTDTPPQHVKKRGAPRTRGPVFIATLLAAVNEARARVAKKQNKAEDKISISTAIKNMDRRFRDELKTARGKPLAAATLETRYHEAMKIWNAAREQEPQLSWLQELGKRYNISGGAKL